VPGLVKGKVDEVHERLGGIVALQGGEDESPTPDKDDQKDDHPADEKQGVHAGLYAEEKLRQIASERIFSLPVGVGILAPDRFRPFSSPDLS
jgi:hypothetical protein